MMFPVANIGNTQIYMHVTFVLTALILIGSGYGLYFIVFLGSLVVHELGHLITASLLGTELSRVELWPFGAVGRLEGVGQLEPLPEAIIAISGPLQSAFLVALGFLVYMGLDTQVPGVYTLGQFPLLEFLIKVNLGLLVMNLVPCLPLDGGRFLRAHLSLRVGYQKASQQMAKLGIWLGGVLTIAGVLGLLKGIRIHALLFGSLIIWSSIEEKQQAALTGVLSVLKRHERLSSKRAISVEEIMVRQDVLVGELVRQLRPSKYFLILVVDSKMNVLGSITEARLLEAFFKGLVNAKMKELI